MTDQPNAGTMAPDETPAPPVQHPLEYSGEAKALGWLVFKNTILTIITLGFYRFWAKTRVRKYIWNSQSLFGERLEYTGTGKELFLGFLIVLAVLVPLGIVVNVGNFYLQTTGSTIAIVSFQITYYILFFYLFGYAVFRARRYQLSRTQWRSIRFAQAGNAKFYGLQFLGLVLLSIVTLGLAIPYMIVRLQKYQVSNTHLGQENFNLDARTMDIFWKWLLCVILAYFTLGISVLWFMAFMVRYMASKTSLGAIKFAVPVKFIDYAKIYIPYSLLMIILSVLFVFLILGPTVFQILLSGDLKFDFPENPIGNPWIALVGFVGIIILPPIIAVMMITHRLLGLFASKLEMHGEIDLDAFVQNAQEASKRGEGLADALDVGGGAGIEVGL